MDATAALENGKIVRAASSSDELIPPLTRIAEMRVRIDESRHDNASLGVDLHRLRHELEILPRVAAPSPDNDAVTRREPPAIDRAHVAGCRTDAGLLIA